MRIMIASCVRVNAPYLKQPVESLNDYRISTQGSGGQPDGVVSNDSQLCKG